MRRTAALALITAAQFPGLSSSWPSDGPGRETPRESRLRAAAQRPGRRGLTWQARRPSPAPGAAAPSLPWAPAPGQAGPPRGPAPATVPRAPRLLAHAVPPFYLCVLLIHVLCHLKHTEKQDIHVDHSRPTVGPSVGHEATGPVQQHTGEPAARVSRPNTAAFCGHTGQGHRTQVCEHPVQAERSGSQANSSHVLGPGGVTEAWGRAPNATQGPVSQAASADPQVCRVTLGRGPRAPPGA